MSSINFSGLASGIDSKAIVEALVDIRRAPMRRLQAEDKMLAEHRQTFTELETSLNKFSTTGKTLDTFDEFVRCSFSDRILHLKMPLVPTPFPLGLSLSYCLIV